MWFDFSLISRSVIENMIYDETSAVVHAGMYVEVRIQMRFLNKTVLAELNGGSLKVTDV